MRKLLAYLAAFGSLVFTCPAQTIAHQSVASQFNNWQAYPQSGPYSNTNLIAGANVVSVNPCSYAAGGAQIPVFVANTPIRVVDNGTPSLSETITPTAITNGGCSATLTTGNAHTGPYYFKSGTYGLQEAINATALSGQLNAILLDTNWFQAGGTAALIYNATGNLNASVQDVTVSPATAYGWNGTHYVGTYSVLGNAAPSIAAGAAAGSSPTVSNQTLSVGTFTTSSVTTGTATTTGTLFTVTVGTVPVNSRAVSCTIQSVGANNFPLPITTTSSGGVCTFAVASAPTVSTAYVFSVHIN